MTLIRPAVPTNAKYGKNKNDVPNRCEACRQTGTPLHAQWVSGVEVWVCIDWKSCKRIWA